MYRKTWNHNQTDKEITEKTITNCFKKEQMPFNKRRMRITEFPTIVPLATILPRNEHVSDTDSENDNNG